MDAKQIITGIGIAIVSAGTALVSVPRGIEIIKDKEIITETVIEQIDYDTMKTDILSKIKAKIPLSIYEYKMAVLIYDYEIKKRGGLTYENVTSKEDLLNRITNDLQ